MSSKVDSFKVSHYFNEMRKQVTNLVLNDFGFDYDRAVKELLKRNFSGKDVEELDVVEKERFDKYLIKYVAFKDWFINYEREVVLDCLRTICESIYVANSIYPVHMEELIERRLNQDKTIGQCFRLVHELENVIATLPVDVNKHLSSTRLIEKEINLLKAWRKSDNRFKKSIITNKLKEILTLLFPEKECDDLILNLFSGKYSFTINLVENSKD